MWFAFLFTPLGRDIAIVLAVAAAVAGGLVGVATHEYNKGKASVQTKWDAATQADIKRGEAARTEAEQYVETPPHTFFSPSPGRVLDHDKWNRDRGAMQPVAPHSIFGFARHAANDQSRSHPQHDGPTPRVLVKPSVPTPMTCADVTWALATLPKATLDYYTANATPEQKAFAAGCLKAAQP